jgi:tetratricopeptide (TPR) repeat protein
MGPFRELVLRAYKGTDAVQGCVMTRWGLALAMMFLSLTALAQPAPPSRQSNPPLPWDADLAMFLAVQPELQKAGIRALASHVEDYEAALKRAPQFFPDGAVVDGRRYVLADGQTETLGVALKGAVGDAANKGAPKMPVNVVANVYVLIALQLGTYYDEMDREEDGIRALDLGLRLSPYPDAAMGAHVGEIMGEKGFALGAEKKFDLALDVYRKGLTLSGISALDRARLERGEGFVLTELDRLDEAEQAYQASLKDEPGNKRAINELAYIARLRAGGPKAPTESVLVPPAAETPKP